MHSALHKCLVFAFNIYFFHNRWFFLEYAPPPPKKKKKKKKKNLTFVSIILYCYEMIVVYGGYWKVFSPLFDHGKSYLKIFAFKFVSVLCGHKVFGIMAIIVPLPKGYTRIKLRDHQLVFRLHRFFSWLLPGRKENWQLWKVSLLRRKCFSVGSAKITGASHLLF